MLRVAISLTLVLAACASVPKQSVELSATVGRDIAVVHQAHRQTVQVLFARMRRDVDRFVDEVYGPWQIASVMQRQAELARSDKQEDRNKSLLIGLQEGFKPEATPQARERALAGMRIVVRMIRKDIETMRNELLSPLNAQYAEVMGAIDRAYYQIHYANSIVTGHLASVVEVHDAQAEALKMIGVDRDLRAETGTKLARVSDDVARVVDAAEHADPAIETAQAAATELKNVLAGLSAGQSGENGGQ